MKIGFNISARNRTRGRGSTRSRGMKRTRSRGQQRSRGRTRSRSMRGGHYGSCPDGMIFNGSKCVPVPKK